jgi:hypothetical protein
MTTFDSPAGPGGPTPGTRAGPNDQSPVNPFFCVADWQDWAIRHRAAFDALAPGARIGQVRRGEVSRVGAELLVIEAAAEGPRVRLERYAGMARCNVHLLFVGADDAWRELLAAGPGTARRLTRERKLQLYVMKSRAEIEAARLDDFLDRLDLVHPKH